MKAQFVYENVHFERGRDPRSIMGIGNRVAQYEEMMRPWLDIVEEKAKKFGFIDNTEEVREIWKNHYPMKYTEEDEESEDLVRAWKRKAGPIWKKRTPTIHLLIRELSPWWGTAEVNHHVKDANEYGVYYILLSDPDHEVDFPGESWPSFDTDEDLQKWTLDYTWKDFVSNRRYLSESVNFERGKDPKASMSIGKAANPFVIEYAEREVDDDGYITGPLPEDHDQNTWFESADAWMIEEVLQNWKEEVDGSWYFMGHMKDNTDEDGDELFHAPEFNDEYVEYKGELYYIPDHKEYWDTLY